MDNKMGADVLVWALSLLAVGATCGFLLGLKLGIWFEDKFDWSQDVNYRRFAAHRTPGGKVVWLPQKKPRR